MIYEVEDTDEDGNMHTYYLRGSDKNEAWAKIGFKGSMVESYTEEEWAEKWAPPRVLS